MNKKISIKRQFNPYMKYKSKKNKRMIGGENCGQYLTGSECIADVECAWKMRLKKCEPKVKTELINQQQNQQRQSAMHEFVSEQPKTDEQTQLINTEKQEQSLKPQSRFVQGKRPLVSQNFPGVNRPAQVPAVFNVPDKQSSRVYTAPTLNLNPPKVNASSIRRVAPSRIDNLELITPLVAYNANWPLITDVVNVPGDGHCLFHALRAGLRSLGLFNGTAIELRTLIVNRLRILLENGENLDVIFSRAAEQGREIDNLPFGTYFETQHATNPISDAKNRVKSQIKLIAKATEEYELAQALAASAPHDAAPLVIKGKIQQPVLNPLIRILNLKRAILEKAQKDLIKYQAATQTAVTIPLNQQVKAYLDSMAISAWGTEIEIWMASIIFGVNIDVYTLPRDPGTNAPLHNGKSKSGINRGQLIPLTPLNRNRDPQRATIRLFNGSGATPRGIHYQVIPASISLNEFQHQEQP
jgi:hypothetical protein